MKLGWKSLVIGTAAFAYAGWKVLRDMEAFRNDGIAKGKRIVILGSGFGGAYAAGELAQLLPQEDNGEIVLVDRHPYLLFTPMLTEAVGAEVEAHHIIAPVDELPKRVQFVEGTIQEIDLKTKTVTVKKSDDRQTQLKADHLVIALGATSNFHHIPGVEDVAIPLKTLDDAYNIRQGALAMLKAACQEENADERKAMLTFVMAGGGYTGVEGIAALNDMVRDRIAADNQIKSSDVRMILAEPLDRLMTEITPDLASFAQVQLERAGIEIKLKTGIKSVDGDKIELTSGEKLRARTLIWAAGIEPNELVGKLGAPVSKKKAIETDRCFAVESFPGVWAIGDCAAVPKADNKGTYEPTAQNATREGTMVARNIVRSLRGEPLQPFTFTQIGELALVGKRKGVARVYGYNFSGIFAWAMWRGVYIAKMPSMGQRLRILCDYLLDFVLGTKAQYHYAATPPSHNRAEIAPPARAAQA